MAERRRPAYRARQALSRLALEHRLMVRRFDRPRMRPSLFIIGAQKAGTTSLHGYLAQHRQVLAPLVKEVHYFDLAYHRGENWYGAHFATLAKAKALEDATGRGSLTFDTTPYYIFHPDAAARIKAFNPDAKVIALLRDPVMRTWSHYWHERARGCEKLSLSEALDAESARIGSAHDTVGEARAERFAHQHYSYCARSEYDRQVARWQNLFPRQNLLFLKSEELFSAPAQTLRQVTDFLGIDPFAAVSEKVLNPGRNDNPSPEIWDRLRERLAASAQETRRLLGERFSWA